MNYLKRLFLWSYCGKVECLDSIYMEDAGNSMLAKSTYIFSLLIHENLRDIERHCWFSMLIVSTRVYSLCREGDSLCIKVVLCHR